MLGFLLVEDVLAKPRERRHYVKVSHQILGGEPRRCQERHNVEPPRRGR
jgi:hypothetical protein